MLQASRTRASSGNQMTKHKTRKSPTPSSAFIQIGCRSPGFRPLRSRSAFPVRVKGHKKEGARVA